MSDQPQDPNHQKWSYEQNRSVAERQHDNETDFGNRASADAITSANHVIRALLLINGGAAIALLAFIGQLVSRETSQSVLKLSEVTAPLTWFAWGVSAAVCSVAFAYLTNFSTASSSVSKSRSYVHPYVEDNPTSKRWTMATWFFQFHAMAAAAISLGFFIYGMLEVREAISLLDGTT